MRCHHCDKPLPEGAQFCVACGKRVASAPIGASSAHPLIGELLDVKYRIVKILGEGGMGTVFEATQTLGTTVRHVAVKTLHTHLATDASLRTRFERECAVLARVSHPNTVQLIDYGVATTSQGKVAFLVMELVNGPSLRDLIEKEAPLEPARALSILRQIAGALAEAHAAGVVHRDLKPENIILLRVGNQRDFVKLLDFGIAKNDSDNLQEKLTQHGAVLGTPAYMSPEQLLGDQVDARSDIFALGLIGYEMLSGKLPFRPAEPWQLVSQRLTAEPEPFESPIAETIPADMKTAIFRSIQRRADERFSSVTAFAFTLEGKTPPAEPAVRTRPTSTAPAAEFARTEIPELPRPRMGTLPSGTALEDAAREARGRVPAGATEVPLGPARPTREAFSQHPLAIPPQRAYDAPSLRAARQQTWPVVVFVVAVLFVLGGLGAFAARAVREKPPELDAETADTLSPDAAGTFLDDDEDDDEIPGLEDDASTNSQRLFPVSDASTMARDAGPRDAAASPDAYLPPIIDAGRPPRDGGRRRRDGGGILRLPWPFPQPPRRR